MEQRTPEWYAERLGKATASMIADATATIKTGEAASRINYRAQLVAERLTGLPQGVDLSDNKYVQHGIETEEQARIAFEFKTGLTVVEVGMIPHPTIEYSGASPDGLVGEHILEIKCPSTATHIGYLKDNKVPSKYRKQMLWQMACCKKEKGYFVSFDPRLDPGNQLLIVELFPEEGEIEALEVEVVKFLAEVAADVEFLKQRALNN